MVESLDNIRSNVAATIELGSNNHGAFEAVGSSMDAGDDADDAIDLEQGKIRIISCFESKFCFVACCFVGSPRPSMASMVDQDSDEEDGRRQKRQRGKNTDYNEDDDPFATVSISPHSEVRKIVRSSRW